MIERNRRFEGVKEKCTSTTWIDFVPAKKIYVIDDVGARRTVPRKQKWISIKKKTISNYLSCLNYNNNSIANSCNSKYKLSNK